MKIPTVVSEGSVPVAPGYPTARPVSLDFSGVAQAAAGLEAAGLRAADRVADAEAVKRREEQTTATLGLLYEATGQMQAAEQELQRGRFDPATGAMLQGPASHREYVARWEDRYRDIEQRMLAQTDDATVRAGLHRLLARDKIERKVKALKHADHLFGEEQKADIDTFEGAALREVMSTPRPDERARQADLFRAFLAGKGAILGADGVTKRLAAFDEKLAVALADEKIRLGVFEAARDLDAVTDPTKREMLMRRHEAAERQRVVAAEREEKRIEKAAEEIRQMHMVTLEAAARDGTLTLTQLDDERRWRTFRSPAEYSHLRTLVEKAPSDRPSDAGLYTVVGLDVNAMNPSVTEGAIDRMARAFLNGEPGLAPKDAFAFKSRLRETREQLQARGRTELGQRQAQAEQELRTALDITTMFDQLDQQQRQLYAIGLEELRTRSRYFDGAEDPLAVATEVGRRLRLVREDRGRLKVKELQGAINPAYPTPADLEAAYQAGRLSKATYQLERRKHLDLQRELHRSQVVPAGPSGAPGPPAPEKPVLGRTSNTPVKVLR